MQNVPSSNVIRVPSRFGSRRDMTSFAFNTTFAMPMPSTPYRVSKSTYPRSFRFVSTRLSVKNVPLLLLTNSVPTAETSCSTTSAASECAVLSTIVYAFSRSVALDACGNRACAHVLVSTVT